MQYKISTNTKQIEGTIHLDGSKSISNRVLIIQALCEEDFEVSHLSTSDDTKALQKALQSYLKNEVIDENQGLVWGEMIIHFDSIQSGKMRLEEAFMQRWENNQIVYLRFFYGEMIKE